MRMMANQKLVLKIILDVINWRALFQVVLESAFYPEDTVLDKGGLVFVSREQCINRFFLYLIKKKAFYV